MKGFAEYVDKIPLYVGQEVYYVRKLQEMDCTNLEQAFSYEACAATVTSVSAHIRMSDANLLSISWEFGIKILESDPYCLEHFTPSAIDTIVFTSLSAAEARAVEFNKLLRQDSDVTITELLERWKEALSGVEVRLINRQGVTE